MTKERLEELIKQGATISHAGYFEIKLDLEQYSVAKAFGKTILLYQPKDRSDPHLSSCCDWCWCLEDLREDVDHAKWEHDMYAKRIERFEPPMWDEIENHFIFRWFNDGIEYIFMVDKKIDIVAIETVFDPCINEFDEHATKENYEKACEIVRELFLKGDVK